MFNINKETLLANELQSMMTQNVVPVSVQEDINHISQQLTNGNTTLKELENQDPFVVDIIQKAMDRM